MGSHFAVWEQFIVEYFIFKYYMTYRTTLKKNSKDFIQICMRFIKFFRVKRTNLSGVVHIWA